MVALLAAAAFFAGGQSVPHTKNTSSKGEREARLCSDRPCSEPLSPLMNRKYALDAAEDEA